MKAVLNIVAAVLIAAGLVVAVASLLTPGQVILGIDFKLAATLIVGGLILHALARALLLLDRIAKELRLLRKAGLEEPAWLRHSATDAATESAVDSASAMAPAMAAAPAVAGSAQGDQSADLEGEAGEDAFEEPQAEAEPEWLKAAVDEVAAPEPEETEQYPAFPAVADEEPEAALIEAAEHAEAEPEDRAPPPLEPVEQPVVDEVGVAIEPLQADAEEEAVAADEPEPAETDVEQPEATEEREEPVAPETEDAEAAGEPEPTDEVEHDRPEVPTRLRPSRDATGAAEDLPPVAEEFAEAEDSQGDAAEEHPALYVVEERMFRGRQARVLSDGTIESETPDGWMRFEDFDHLEEYLEAMAEMDR